MTNESGMNETTELPSGGTDQHSAASQAAAEPANNAGDAATQPAAERLYANKADAAAQQQAPGKNARDSDEDVHAQAAQPDSDAGAEDGADAAQEDGHEDPDGSDTHDAEQEQGAPERYDFKKVPGVQLDGEVLEKFSEAARALNLSQDAAQSLLDQVAPAIARQQQDTLKQLSADWVEAVKADKEIGGDKLSANLAIARKARDAFGSDGLRKLLNESRLGDHPEVVRFFVRAGKAISEDVFVAGGTRPPAGGKDAASVLYGKHN